MDLQSLISKYDMKLRGVIHVGAHHGEEYTIYNSKSLPVVFFEPVLDNLIKLKQNLQTANNVTIFPCALGNQNKIVNMNIESKNDGQSCSILMPKLHLSIYPHITFNLVEPICMYKLDDIEIEKELYNLMVIDVQGYELEVLKGSFRTLNNIDYIISEVSVDELYENCAKLHELDQFLSEFNFSRVETDLGGGIWGDALYIKDIKNN